MQDLQHLDTQPYAAGGSAPPEDETQLYTAPCPVAQQAACPPAQQEETQLYAAEKLAARQDDETQPYAFDAPLCAQAVADMAREELQRDEGEGTQCNGSGKQAETSKNENQVDNSAGEGTKRTRETDLRVREENCEDKQAARKEERAKEVAAAKVAASPNRTARKEERAEDVAAAKAVAEEVGRQAAEQAKPAAAKEAEHKEVDREGEPDCGKEERIQKKSPKDDEKDAPKEDEKKQEDEETDSDGDEEEESEEETGEETEEESDEENEEQQRSKRRKTNGTASESPGGGSDSPGEDEDKATRTTRERERLRTALADFAKESKERSNDDRKHVTKFTTTPLPVLLLRHPIREYQHVGLHCLATWQEKRFNGILADEMGLGKTIQTIALLAHLAIEKEIWGPHLIIVPTSVQFNWEMELKKWAPGMKVLTYVGTKAERQQRRRGWQAEDAFHVCIVSYAVVMQDLSVFKRKAWYYMVLDEAHHIKNFRSMKWQQLIRFRTARRLLLTGTPLQNDLMEMWSLLHFLMPDVFESYHDFKDWFGDPLNLAIQQQTVASEEGLISRLHSVLRPFMLRRLKSEVEKQMPGKHEHIEKCALSRRQQVLYEEFMQRKETQKVLGKGDYLGMMSILMQLRKVCNHPELFETRHAQSSFAMDPLELFVPGLILMGLWGAIGGQRVGEWGFCSLLLPLLTLWRLEVRKFRGFTETMYMPLRASKAIPPRSRSSTVAGPHSRSDRASRSCQVITDSPASDTSEVQVSGKRRRVHRSLDRGRNGAASSIPPSLPQLPFRITEKSANFFAEARQQLVRAESSWRLERTKAVIAVDCFCQTVLQDSPVWGIGVLDLLSLSCSRGDVCGTPQSRVRTLASRARPRGYAGGCCGQLEFGSSGDAGIELAVGPNAACQRQTVGGSSSSSAPASGQAADSRQRRRGKEMAAGARCKANGASVPVSEPPVARRAPRAAVISAAEKREWRSRRRRRPWWHESSIVYDLCQHVMLDLEQNLRLHIVPWVLRVQKVLVRSGCNLVIPVDEKAPRTASGGQYSLPTCHVRVTTTCPSGHLRWWERMCTDPKSLQRAGAALLRSARLSHTLIAQMLCRLPDKHYLESDCGKLARLSVKLHAFKKSGCKCIIFTQFSKMLDVLEAFVNHHRFTYVRLDGSVKVERRQDLVDAFNADQRIFLFIASTRAGGIGINLTGANIVIFYDSDWNPAMDRQAMDRAHRIGQTREVHIYRLISEHTVEENILRRQLQKRQLDDIVVDQGHFNTEALNARNQWTASEVRTMLTGDHGARFGQRMGSLHTADVSNILGTQAATAAVGVAQAADAADTADTAEASTAVAGSAVADEPPITTEKFEHVLEAVEDADDAVMAETARTELWDEKRVLEEDFAEQPLDETRAIAEPLDETRAIAEPLDETCAK